MVLVRGGCGTVGGDEGDGDIVGVIVAVFVVVVVVVDCW